MRKRCLAVTQKLTSVVMEKGTSDLPKSRHIQKLLKEELQKEKSRKRQPFLCLQ